MIRLFSLSLLLTAASWSAASACMPDSSVMSGLEDYSAITPSDWSRWDIDSLSVGLVYVKMGVVQNKVPERSMYQKEEKPFVDVKYNLIEDISGDFVTDDDGWIPEISESTKKRELAMRASRRDFAFWDRRDLSTPLVTGYEGGTSCGPFPSKTLLADQYYLQFKKDHRTVGLEIVTGPQDPFVQDWKKIYANAQETKLNRSPQSYFKDISGFQEISLKTCPSEKELEILEITREHSLFLPSDLADTFDNMDLASFQPDRIFEQKSSFNSDMEKLEILDVFRYQPQEWRCEDGSQYLVLDKKSRRRFRGGHSGFSPVSPQHRYIEVKDGEIDTDNIRSKITVLPDESGSTKVSVEQVKSWIREANDE